MTLEEEILQLLNADAQPGSAVYKPVNAFEYISITETKNIFDLYSFYTSHYTQSINDYENSAVDMFYDESCSDESKIATLFFGSSLGYGADTTGPLKSKHSDTKAIYSKINYMFDYKLTYSNIYAFEFHTNYNYDYLNSELFEINLASYDLSNNLTNNIHTFILSGSSQYADSTKYSTIKIISGSLNNGQYSYEEIGQINPEKNIIVFDADKLDSILNFDTNYSIVSNVKNVNKFYNSFSQSVNVCVNNNIYPIVGTGLYTQNNYKTTIDIELPEFNYSNNPTFFDQSSKKFRSTYTQTMENVYFTTIGLYDSKYQLLAVAKLSTPFLKNFTEKYMFEITIKT